MIFVCFQMPRSKTGEKRKQVPKEDIEKAIDMVLKKEITVYKAAKDFGLSKTTLLRQLKAFKESGLPNYEYKKNNDTKKVFSHSEEILLVNYIEKAAELHYGLTLKDVRTLAYQFAKQNQKPYDPSWDTNKLAGKDWLIGFRKRFKAQLALRKPEATSLSRSTSFNKANVSLVFENFKKALRNNPGIGPFNIWNCDETGISTVHVPPKILAKKGVKQVGGMTSGERGTNVTMIGAINAGGGFMPPMLIFPRTNFKDYMLKGAPVGTLGGANPSGWSNEELFFEFAKHFVKYSSASKTNPVILLMDNHESHISVKTIQLAKDNGVTLVTFHPHTSHKMQPLDRGVFGPFKTYYNNFMNTWMSTSGNIAKPATIYDVAEIVGKAFPLAFTPSNIATGFRVSGLQPLNENIFPDSDFLPSNVTDRAMVDNQDSTIIVSPGASGSNTKKPGEHENEPPTDFYASPTPSTSSMKDITIVSPEVIRPYPKAMPRKQTRKGRAKGKSCILTDTPEKARIEQEKIAKDLKKMEKELKKMKKQEQALKKPATKLSDNKKVKKVLFFRPNDPSSSDSDEDFDEDLCQNESDMSEDFVDLEDPDHTKIEVGSFVLIRMLGKKSSKHFVAEVFGKDCGVYEVKYLKKDLDSQKFTFVDPIRYEVDEEDVVWKLPQPLMSGGSERQIQKLTFGVDLSSFNVG